MQIAHSNIIPTPKKLTSKFAKKMAYKRFERTCKMYEAELEAIFKDAGERPVYQPED